MYLFYEVFVGAPTEYLESSCRGNLYFLVMLFGKFCQVRLVGQSLLSSSPSPSHPQNPAVVCKPVKPAVPP